MNFRFNQEQQKDKSLTESPWSSSNKLECSTNGVNNIKKVLKDKKVQLYDKWDSNIKL